ncbi:MAG: CDGSH iron-sulfur domain-containing protein [bacterium]
MSGVKIIANKNGPYLVQGGDVTLEGMDGEELDHQAPFALCRCGHSRAKPFCDGAHGEAGFVSENVGEPE